MSNISLPTFWLENEIQMNKLYLLNKIGNNDFDKILDLECENVINESKIKIKKIGEEKIALLTGFVSGIASTSLTFSLTFGYLNVEQIVDTFF